MPLGRIDTPQRLDAQRRREVGDAVHQALVESIGVPPDDRFQVIVGHAAAAGAVRREDVLVNLVEVVKGNWSFGNGEAQYAT